MKEGSELENTHIYIDSMTQEAFNESVGGDHISREQLAHLGQIFRSSEGRDMFEYKTKIHIGGKEDMKKMFNTASEGGLDLTKILQMPEFAKYAERKSHIGLD